MKSSSKTRDKDDVDAENIVNVLDNMILVCSRLGGERFQQAIDHSKERLKIIQCMHAKSWANKASLEGNVAKREHFIHTTMRDCYITLKSVDLAIVSGKRCRAISQV